MGVFGPIQTPNFFTDDVRGLKGKSCKRKLPRNDKSCFQSELIEQNSVLGYICSLTVILRNEVVFGLPIAGRSGITWHHLSISYLCSGAKRKPGNNHSSKRRYEQKKV